MKFCTFFYFYFLIHLILHLGNEGKVHGVRDGKGESKMQHNKEENINKDNSSADKCLHMNAATEDISPVNQISDCRLSADSLESGKAAKKVGHAATCSTKKAQKSFQLV